jgi:hypothetical protein
VRVRGCGREERGIGCILVHHIVHRGRSIQSGLAAGEVGREVDEGIATTEVRVLQEVKRNTRGEMRKEYEEGDLVLDEGLDGDLRDLSILLEDVVEEVLIDLHVVLGR